jgi:hypothetical protein
MHGFGKVESGRLSSTRGVKIKRGGCIIDAGVKKSRCRTECMILRIISSSFPNFSLTRYLSEQSRGASRSLLVSNKELPSYLPTR